MLDKRELLDAIAYCEEHINNFNDCERLASLYTIYNQKFKKTASEPIYEVIVQVSNDSEFLSAINGKNAENMWNIMDMLMRELSENDPQLYNSILKRIL